MVNTAIYISPLGELLLAEDDGALSGLWIKGEKYYPAVSAETVTANENTQIFIQTRKWLDRYFRGEKPSPQELRLAPAGSEFRREIWRILIEIPYGTTMTYSEIARKTGRKNLSAQAVGGAVGHNSISIIIPCHRVVGAEGDLTGYAGGIDKKIILLEHEGVDTTGMFYKNKERCI